MEMGSLFGFPPEFPPKILDVGGFFGFVFTESIVTTFSLIDTDFYWFIDG